MFTTIDKALVAIVMGALFVVTAIWGEGWWGQVTEETVAVIIGVLTPILIWLFPNVEA